MKEESPLGRLPSLAYRLDPEGRVLWVNEAIERYGYAVEDVVGRSWLDFVHPGDRAATARNVTARKRGDRTTRELRVRLLVVGAHPLTDAWQTTPVRDALEALHYAPMSVIATAMYEADRFLGTYGVAFELPYEPEATAHRDELERMRYNETWYRRIFESANDGIFLMDGDVIVDANPMAARIFGYPAASSLVGRTPQELSPEYQDEHGATSEEAAGRLVEQTLAGPAQRFPWVHRRTDGTVFPTEVTLTRLWADMPDPEESSGNLLLAIVRDMTQQRESEERLKDSEKLFAMFMDHIPAAVTITAEDERILFANKMATAAMDLTQNDEGGPFGLDDALPGEEADSLRRDAEEAFAVGGTDTTRQTSLPGGRTARMRYLRFRFQDRHGNNRLGSIMLDVTEQWNLQEQLYQAQKMEALGRLAGGVAHDFNNLLTVIKGNVELVELFGEDRGATPEDISEFLGNVRNAAQLAENVTRQLLLFSRTSVARTELVSLRAIMTQMEKMLGRVIPSSITQEVIHRGTDCTVRGDPTHIQQVVLNLAVNAADAMPNGGNLTFETDCRTFEGGVTCAICGREINGRFATLTVEDTGEGIPSGVRAQIFDAFFTTKDAGKGTGLGLSTVADIVRRSEGHLTLVSEEGSGSTFCLLFPLQEGKEEPTRDGEPTKVERLGLEGTVFLVEDNPLLLDLERRTLERAGLHVHAFKDPLRALHEATAGGTRPDVLVTDHMMPGISGLELTRKILQRYPDLPVLFTSGHTGSTTIAEDATELGLPFLAKPFSMAQLVATVAGLLKRRA